MSFFESRARLFNKLENIKVLKSNITGLCEVEILKITWGLFTQKEMDATKKLLFVFLHWKPLRSPEPSFASA